MFTALARRFTKDERGKRKKKVHEAADRGRESRNEKGEDAGVKNVSRARWRTNGARERERKGFAAKRADGYIFNLLPSAQKCVLHLLPTDFLEP